MILFKIYNENIVSIEANREYCSLSELLCAIARSSIWKQRYPYEVGLGYTISGNTEIHYVCRNAYPDILMFMFNQCLNVMCEHTEEEAPIGVYEKWSPPGNQESAMASGYDSVPENYQFIQGKYYTAPGTVGWRQYPPVL